MKTPLLILGQILIQLAVFSQNPGSIVWERTFGGSYLDYGKCIVQTSDGGYVSVGVTESTDGDITASLGSGDIWVVKTDQFGGIQWQKVYGGSSYEEAFSIQQTNDGGYIIAGCTMSSNGDVTVAYGASDFWVVKTNAAGDLQWQKSFGGSNYDIARCIRQTADGGYVIGGMTNSTDGLVTGNHGNNDYWVIKINQTGDIEWQKVYGGPADEEVYCIQQTTDGGYIFSGYCYSLTGDVTGHNGYSDIWLVKTDDSGNIQWQKCYGSDTYDAARDLQLTSDGGYIIAGTVGNDNGTSPGHYGFGDGWLIKIDQVGNIQWQKNYGGSEPDNFLSIKQTMDGGFICGAYTQSYDHDVTGNHGGGDIWVVKTRNNGDIAWSKCYGGSEDDVLMSIIETTDGGYSFFGSTNSANGDISFNHGISDYWLVRMCSSEPVSISISDETYCTNTILTASPGFSNYLWNTSEQTQSIEVSNSGYYNVLATNSAGCYTYKEVYIQGPIEAYPYQEICLVTVDEATGKNLIAVNKKNNVHTDSIVFYRSDDGGTLFNKIGSLGIDEVCLFTDENAKPGDKSYQYKISTKNIECNKQSELSLPHQTILLDAKLIPATNKIELEWTSYVGVGFTQYWIFRSNASGLYTKIAEVLSASLSFIDENPIEEAKYYQVRVKPEEPCSPSKSVYEYVLSNVVNPYTYGIEETLASSVNFYPNPFTETLTVKVDPSFIGSNYSVSDLTGRNMLSGTIIAEETNFSVSGLSPGIYVLFLEKYGLAYKIIKKSE